MSSMKIVVDIVRAHEWLRCNRCWNVTHSVSATYEHASKERTPAKSCKCCEWWDHCHFNIAIMVSASFVAELNKLISKCLQVDRPRNPDSGMQWRSCFRQRLFTVRHASHSWQCGGVVVHTVRNVDEVFHRMKSVWFSFLVNAEPTLSSQVQRLLAAAPVITVESNAAGENHTAKTLLWVVSVDELSLRTDESLSNNLQIQDWSARDCLELTMKVTHQTNCMFMLALSVACEKFAETMNSKWMQVQ